MYIVDEVFSINEMDLRLCGMTFQECKIYQISMFAYLANSNLKQLLAEFLSRAKIEHPWHLELIQSQPFMQKPPARISMVCSILGVILVIVCLNATPNRPGLGANLIWKMICWGCCWCVAILKMHTGIIPEYLYVEVWNDVREFANS